MNKLSKRVWLNMILSLFLLCGLVVIAVRYARDAPKWAAYRSVVMADYSGKEETENAQQQTQQSVLSYTVTDRNGETVLKENTGRTYHADAAVRSSMIHLLGDKYGMIARVVLNEYGKELSDFDYLNGTYHTDMPETAMKLTVSVQVQAAAYDALAGRKGVVGVYNYETGEILCMVSSPNYDPENVPEIDGDAPEYEGIYTNRFVNSLYIPGSTFKLVTAAAALENIPGIHSRTFCCEGQSSVDGQTVVCNRSHGDVSFEEALCRSCNVAFAEIALELGKDCILDYAQQLGVMDSLFFDGYTTKKGSVNLEKAGNLSIAWAGIGQYEDLINPCQYMTLMGAIANGGRSAVPYLVQEVSVDGSANYEAKTVMNERLLDRATADELAEMMHYAVVNNYGEWNFSGLYAGAKSGTAEQGDGSSDALFAGFVQDEDCPLAFIVIVEDGGGGSETCIPIISQVLNACVVDYEN